MKSVNLNRLAGSLILLIAALIIVPSLLDFASYSNDPQLKQVPDAPTFSVIEQPEQFPQQQFERQMPSQRQLSDEQPIDQMQRTETVNTEQTAVVLENDTVTVTALSADDDYIQQPQSNAPPSTEVVTTRVEPNASNIAFNQSAWVIQLGSFAQESNAVKLQQTLQQAGFVTFNRRIRAKSGWLTKVYVGPSLQKSELEQALSEVNRLAKVKGIITPFRVK